MGKQLDMFPPPEPDADERLNRAQAEMRRAEMERQRSRVDARVRLRRPEHHRSVATRCPSCGSHVTIRVS